MSGCYVKHKPGGALGRAVECFWYCEGYGAEHRWERRLPSNSFQVVIDLRNDWFPVVDRERLEVVGKMPPALVAGLQTSFQAIDTTSLGSLVGVVFRSAYAGAFFRVAMDELTGREVELGAFWGAGAGRLRERLQSARTVKAKFRELECVLRERLDEDFEPHVALPFVLGEFGRQWGAGRVAEVAERVGWSGRRLTQVFREQVGLPPKAYCRVERLQRVLRSAAAADRTLDWARVAMDCGYYDQAHFAHEFRAFSGLTPGEFSGRERPWVNHVAMG